MHNLEKIARFIKLINQIYLQEFLLQYVIKNQAIFVEKHCAKLTENIPAKINDSYHPNNILETPVFTCLLICFLVLLIIEVLLLKTCP